MCLGKGGKGNQQKGRERERCLDETEYVVFSMLDCKNTRLHGQILSTSGLRNALLMRVVEFLSDSFGSCLAAKTSLVLRLLPMGRSLSMRLAKT